MPAQHRIVPHLWYDKEAREAAEFYTSAFPDSRITDVHTIHDTPSGDVEVMSFELLGQPFMAISAGPLFQFNPSVSFIVSRDTTAEVDALWDRLGDGGEVLMPLDAYPFSPRYGWLKDRYGLSWQLIVPSNPDADWRPPVMPSLLFTGDNCGNAEAAIDLYTSVFANAARGELIRYGSDQPPNREGTVMFADFKIENTWFAAMDSAQADDFRFNEAVSFMVKCDTQKAIDHYWDALSAVPEAEQCGWLKDRFGLSWQIVPTAMDDMMRSGSREQLARVTEAFMQMKKFDLAALERAYRGG